MFLVHVLIMLVGYSPVNVRADRKYSALSFGQTTSDYIQWSPVDTSSIRTQFSACTWIRKRYNQASLIHPVVLDYYPDHDRSYSYGIVLGSNGRYNWVVGTALFLRSKHNVPVGHWFHACWTWSTSDYTTRVYLNGDQIGSEVTNRRQVRSGGEMCLGNKAWDPKYPGDSFGGDLYKVNIFNRVLTQSEIRGMSSDMCSTEEERLTTNRIVKWEDILLKERAGNVTEISSGCTETLPGILRRLQKTEQELEKTKSNLTSTYNELDSTKTDLTQRLENRKEKERLYLTLSIVFGSLSTVSLILLVTLLVKQVSANRARDTVRMSELVTDIEGERGEECDETGEGAGAQHEEPGIGDEDEEIYDNLDLYRMGHGLERGEAGLDESSNTVVYENVEPEESDSEEESEEESRPGETADDYINTTIVVDNIDQEAEEVESLEKNPETSEGDSNVDNTVLIEISSDNEDQSNTVDRNVQSLPDLKEAREDAKDLAAEKEKEKAKKTL